MLENRFPTTPYQYLFYCFQRCTRVHKILDEFQACFVMQVFWFVTPPLSFSYNVTKNLFSDFFQCIIGFKSYFPTEKRLISLKIHWNSIVSFSSELDSLISVIFSVIYFPSVSRTPPSCLWYPNELYMTHSLS